MAPTLEQVGYEVRRAISGLSEAQMQLRNQGGWTIQQVLEHLLLTFASTEAVLLRTVRRGRITGASPSLPQRFSRYLICRFGWFPSGRSAPDAVYPPPHSAAHSGDYLASLVSQGLARVESALEQTETAFGVRARSVNHLALGPLSPDEWRGFHRAHVRHHLRQIQAILAANRA